MGIINADELAKSYKLSLLKKIKAGDLHDDDLFQISSIRTNPKYFDTNAIDLDEFTKYIALKIGEHTGVEVTPYHDSGDKIATITVNNVPVDIYAKDLVVDTDYVAEQYDPNKSYSVGDYCMHNNKLYKCITAIDDSIVDRSFDPSKWTEVTVTGEISNVPQLPAVSATDNDKILKVVNGSWDKGSQDVLIIDCGDIRLGSSNLNFPNGLTCVQIYNWLQNGTYIIFKVKDNGIYYYSNACATSSSQSGRFHIRFTDFYSIYIVSHYEYIITQYDTRTYAPLDHWINDSYVPMTYASDAGKALIVNSSGHWAKADIPSQLPAVTSSDEGKVLTVNSSGNWVAADLPDGSNTEY